MDPQLPREGITKRKLPHAGSILPWPWESKEREDLGEFRAWGERELGRASWARGKTEEVGERENEVYMMWS